MGPGVRGRDGRHRHRSCRGPGRCRWVAVRHAEDHVHLVATLVREDGRVPAVWNDWPKLATVAHHYEQQFGLRSTAGREDHTAAPRPGVKEQVTARRAGRAEPARVTLRRKVQAAAASSSGFDEFTTRLTAAGVTVWPRTSDLNPGQVTGYSVSLDDWANAAGQPVRFGGGKLAPDLTLPKLRARWHPASAAPPVAGAESPDRQRSAPPRPTGPVTGSDAERVLREAERIVRDAAHRIGAQTRSEPDAAADAAWAASDILAAAAAAIEGDARGPLTGAAEAFERAGRDSHYRIAARSDTGNALRTAGRMIALLTPHTTRHGTQLAALTTALAALAAAVADLRTTQQRMHQADAALAACKRLRPAGARLTRPNSAAAPAGVSTEIATGSQRIRWPRPTNSGPQPHHPAGRWRPPRQPGRGPTR